MPSDASRAITEPEFPRVTVDGVKPPAQPAAVKADVDPRPSSAVRVRETRRRHGAAQGAVVDEVLSRTRFDARRER
jgi:hypothetical protein